ncbi:MAG: TorF family putative porin, partial [Pseudolabrys sp.]
MKKVVLSVVAALAVSAAMPAFAADMPAKAPKVVAPAPPPSPWDIAFGAGIMNDYIFRGVTQSGHKGSVAAYFEPRYNINSNWQLYAGLSGESIKFANNAAAEIDFYGGVRSTWGPLTFDVGYWYYYYPGGQCYGNGPLQPAAPTQAGDCGFPIFVNGNVAKSVAS